MQYSKYLSYIVYKGPLLYEYISIRSRLTVDDKLARRSFWVGDI